MKWTNDQIKQLVELCEKGVSNAEIAKTMKINLKDVHAKRSQLGITIPKIQAAQAQAQDKPAAKKAAAANTKPAPKKTASYPVISKAFKDLHDAFLLAIGSDRTSQAEAKVLSATNELLINTESLFELMIQRV